MPEHVRLKKIVNPDDESQWLLVPVRLLYPHMDPKQRAQGKCLRVNNAAYDPRQVRTQMVKNATDLAAGADPDSNDGDRIEVERIEVCWLVDPKTGNQVFGLRLANNDPPPRKWDSIDGDPALRKGVYYVRITANQDSKTAADQKPDDVPYIEIERMHALPYVDPKNKNRGSLWRIGWPTNKTDDTVNDPDSPFPCVFEAVNVDQLVVEDQKVDGVCDPPYRLDPAQNPVNIKWGGVIQYQTDDAGGTYAPGDTQLKTGDTIDNYKKLLVSVFFNLKGNSQGGPDDQPARSCIVQWGGRPNLGADYGIIDGAGIPYSSRIQLGRMGPFEGSQDNSIDVQLIGCVSSSSTPRPAPKTFWDDYGFVWPAPDTDPVPTSTAAMLSARLMLGGIKSVWRNDLTSFVNKWHELLIMIDASGVDFAPDPEPFYNYSWAWEANWTDLGVGFAFNSYNTFLAANGYDPSAGFAPGISAHTITLDLRGGPYNTDVSLVPNIGLALDELVTPFVTPPVRVAVHYNYQGPGETSPSHFIDFYGHAGSGGLTYPDTTCTCQMMLDGKLYKGDPGADPPIDDPGFVCDVVFDDQSAGGFFSFTENGTGGFFIDGGEPLGVPICGQPQQAFDLNVTLGAATAMAKLQMWFDSDFVDLRVTANQEKFFEQFTPNDPLKPLENVPSLRPAKFAADDAALLAALPPPTADEPRPKSPAWLHFGRPDIYCDGGPPAKDPDAPGTYKQPLSGFGKNWGLAGDMKAVNRMLSYSPGPSKIVKQT